MTLSPSVGVPLALIFAGAAQCDTLIQQTVVTNHGGFPDHDTHAVVDEQPFFRSVHRG